ncbi:hypothetical protein DID76_02300 [Candidatus Marinamargulisbacteria bacterium SCGC AG-414-C22]|nr:hypothetical protein DID76_02300 [Candidatus Marinamargulisbacteria bacterium SCGC AG-414-C22]
MIETPIGVTDFVPEDAKIHKEQYACLNSLFAKLQYEPIRTPTIEYYDSLAQGIGPSLEQSSIKFIDPTGKVLVLRPDHTTPIARMVATQMKEATLPLKLYYMDPVFRNTTENNQNIEIFQAGCEYIGNDSAAADSDIIKCCIEALQALGYDDIGIDIGHISFIDGLSDQDKQSLLDGNYLAFGRIPKRGGLELVKDQQGVAAVYKDLTKTYPSADITINRGLVKGIRYYTGIIFEAYLKSSRHVVASGGRYNYLLAKFGYDQPAVGFALNLSVLRALK